MAQPQELYSITSTVKVTEPVRVHLEEDKPLLSVEEGPVIVRQALENTICHTSSLISRTRIPPTHAQKQGGLSQTLSDRGVGLCWVNRGKIWHCALRPPISEGEESRAVYPLASPAKLDVRVSPVTVQGTATSFSYQTALTHWQCHGPCLGRKPIREEMRKEQLSSQSLSPARKAHIHTHVVHIGQLYSTDKLIIENRDMPRT
ncbi:hypothetical protein H8959_010553 [Pygathrix nigripes]